MHLSASFFVDMIRNLNSYNFIMFRAAE